MKPVKKHCDLQSCMLCKLSIKEWLPAIDSNRQNFHFKKGELLFQEGEKMNGIYFIYSGKIKVHKKWGDSKELIVRFAGKGDIAGHRGLGKDNRYPVSGTALEPVTACYIDFKFFESTLKVNYNFIHELMLFYASELKESELNMRNLAHMPVKGRIAQALLNLKAKFGVAENGAINFTVSRQDFASYVGSAYETVFRLLNELQDEKIIRLEGKDFAIIDEKKLSALI